MVDPPQNELLAGRRVLIVEDEMIVLMAIEDMLGDLGCDAVIAAATINQALACIDDGAFDFATLDLNLNGDRSYAVADALAARGIPFVFSTGYSDPGISPIHRDRPVLRKPYGAIDFIQAVRGLIEPAATPP